MDISYEYMAGLFDGEGWISINRNPASRNRGRREWTFVVTIAMTMREEFLVNSFANKLGGKVTLQKNRSANHSLYYKWQGFRGVVENFNEHVGEFVVAKRPQLELAMHFIDIKKQNTTFRPVLDDEYNEFSRCFDNMKALNEKGVGKKIILT